MSNDLSAAHYTPCTLHQRNAPVVSFGPFTHLVKGECELIEITSMRAVVQIPAQGASPGSMGIWRGEGEVGVQWSQVTTTSAGRLSELHETDSRAPGFGSKEVEVCECSCPQITVFLFI